MWMVSSILGWVTLATEESVSDHPLVSVLTGHKRVFASTREAPHQGWVEDRVWVTGNFLKSMPGGGAFAGDPDGVADLYYYTPRPVEPGPQQRGSHRVPSAALPTVPSHWEYGLYRLSAGGQRWQRMGEEDNFHHLLVHGTNLVAIMGPKPDGKQSMRVLRSTDQGIHWTDLSPKGGFQSVPTSSFPDPDHPDLVCLKAHGLRGYILQASDSSYQWQEERELSWQRRHPSQSWFLEAPQALGRQVSYAVASLENYFQLPFGSRIVLPRLILTPGGARSFELGREVVVTVQVADVGIPKQSQLLNWLDLWEGTHFWGMRRIRPDGTVERIAPLSVQGLMEFRNTPDWRMEGLAPGGVYRRSLNLSKIAPFAERGRYQVQLGYDSSTAADPKMQEWAVQLEAPVIEIEIR